MTSIPPSRWITRTFVGILLATFFSDVSHEMCTAVLPLYLGTIGLGAASLGVIEGVADLLVSLSKLAGGVVGHHVTRKRPWTALGYLVTAVGTTSMGFANRLASLVALRTIAWSARGFRSPLRDYLLADAVPSSHYGRAYGLERAGDMLGAVVGPLIAWVLVWFEVGFREVIVWAILPGVLAAAAIWFLVHERADHVPAELGDEDDGASASGAVPAPIPRRYWVLLIGVLLFGLGDFSRTFIIFLAAGALGTGESTNLLSVAVLVYLFHNVVSAAAAYPTGHLGDRRAKLPILVWGYALGVATNLVFALFWQSFAGVCVAVALSGVYIAIEETLEKAVVAELLPRQKRSLGFGILASANALGDMLSSLMVGLLLARGQGTLAFGMASVAGVLGVAWLTLVFPRFTRASSQPAS